jgi:hypothetical protein
MEKRASNSFASIGEELRQEKFESANKKEKTRIIYVKIFISALLDKAKAFFQ